MKIVENGDTEFLKWFDRGEDIRHCRATPEVKLEDGRILPAMTQQVVKKWIYYNHLYPYNCRWID